MKTIFAGLVIVSMTLFGCGSTGTNAQAPNFAPVLRNATPDQVATAGSAFSYTLPENTFNDANGDVLTYTATLQGGAALPAWLTFNPVTRTLSGTPSTGDVGAIQVVIMANDGKEASGPDTFNITVEQSPEQVQFQNALALLEQGTYASLSETKQILQSLANNGYSFSTQDKNNLGQIVIKLSLTADDLIMNIDVLQNFMPKDQNDSYYSGN